MLREIKKGKKQVHAPTNTRTDTDWKIKIQSKITVYQRSYDAAVTDYIRTAKRVDRDKVLQLKARLDMCNELLQY